ncbi:hypothetical protein D6853_03565 [Butyrivibrio sp. X503]|uniref:hypothetical protein n=1 Tax=Butyrivibrio sp. X503 TaxID=2364878 RepID=UPI000EA9388A|nr:hypothetical protein [Butyrivibrio sp. X503]RKM57106.1 hypothetical protein D6853_03565 [Butyrivibrio sp. X503]
MISCKKCGKQFEITNDRHFIFICSECMNGFNVETSVDTGSMDYDIFLDEKKVGFIEEVSNSVVKSYIVRKIHCLGECVRTESEDVNEIIDEIRNAIKQAHEKEIIKQENKKAIVEKYCKEYNGRSVCLYSHDYLGYQDSLVTLRNFGQGQWLIVEKYFLSGEFRFERETEIFDTIISLEEFRTWITEFVETYFDELSNHRFNERDGLPHIEDFGRVLSVKKEIYGSERKEC